MDLDDLTGVLQVVIALIALAGSVVLGLARWLKRRRPKKLKMLLENPVSTIKIKYAHDKNDFVITFKEMRVESLYCTPLLLYNTGQDTIDDVQLKVKFSHDSILYLHPDNSLSPNDIECVYEPDLKYQIPIRFVRSKNLYGDAVRIEIYSKEPFKICSVVGGGRDWGVEFFNSERNVLNRIKKQIFLRY